MNAVSVSFIPLAAFFSALNMLGMSILQLMLVRFKGTGEFRVATDVPIRFITRDPLHVPSSGHPEGENSQTSTSPCQVFCQVFCFVLLRGDDDNNSYHLLSIFYVLTTIQIWFLILKAILDSRCNSHSSWGGNWSSVTLNKVSKVTYLLCFRLLILLQSHLTLKPGLFPTGCLL